MTRRLVVPPTPEEEEKRQAFVKKMKAKFALRRQF